MPSLGFLVKNVFKIYALILPCMVAERNNCYENINRVQTLRILRFDVASDGFRVPRWSKLLAGELVALSVKRQHPRSSLIYPCPLVSSWTLRHRKFGKEVAMSASTARVKNSIIR